MDTHHATIIGLADDFAEEFSVLGHASNPGADGNSNELHSKKPTADAANQVFKEITSHMRNSAEVHVIGTVHEQFN